MARNRIEFTRTFCPHLKIDQALRAFLLRMAITKEEVI
jgi:hypothetical protein